MVSENLSPWAGSWHGLFQAPTQQLQKRHTVGKCGGTNSSAWPQVTSMGMKVTLSPPPTARISPERPRLLCERGNQMAVKPVGIKAGLWEGEAPRIILGQGGGTPGPGTAAPSSQAPASGQPTVSCGCRVRSFFVHGLKGVAQLNACCLSTARTWPGQQTVRCCQEWDKIPGRKIKGREGA